MKLKFIFLCMYLMDAVNHNNHKNQKYLYIKLCIHIQFIFYLLYRKINYYFMTFIILINNLKFISLKKKSFKRRHFIYFVNKYDKYYVLNNINYTEGHLMIWIFWWFLDIIIITRCIISLCFYYFYRVF